MTKRVQYVQVYKHRPSTNSEYIMYENHSASPEAAGPRCRRCRPRLSTPWWPFHKWEPRHKQYKCVDTDRRVGEGVDHFRIYVLRVSFFRVSVRARVQANTLISPFVKHCRRISQRLPRWMYKYITKPALICLKGHTNKRARGWDIYNRTEKKDYNKRNSIGDG